MDCYDLFGNAIGIHFILRKNMESIYCERFNGDKKEYILINIINYIFSTFLTLKTKTKFRNENSACATDDYRCVTLHTCRRPQPPSHPPPEGHAPPPWSLAQRRRDKTIAGDRCSAAESVSRRRRRNSRGSMDCPPACPSAFRVRVRA